MRTIELDELFPAGTPGVRGAPSGRAVVGGLAYDSRKVSEGALFFCVGGEVADGHDFAAEAVAGGAAALVVERPLGLGVPEVVVESAREAMARCAVCFYGDPTAGMQVVGVTGTNGKTTTAYMVRALVEATGQRCGLLGTVGSVIGEETRPAVRTTPEAIDLQSDFAAMAAAGQGSCAMEVSSHALAMGRTDGVHFTAGVFTNLSRDHLDFHHTMEEYFLAKRRLFAEADGLGVPPPPVKVIGVDDPYGERLAAELPGAVTFSVRHGADYSADEVHVGGDGTSATLLTPEGERQISLPLPGRFNLANAVGALAVVHALGGDIDALLEALEKGVNVPGRFQPVEEGQDFAVVVDYAHTPDSLENVLRAAREITAGRVVCVFGAGGDRDRGKRPLMGEVGGRLADVAVITSDNPRSEEPNAIIEEVVAGARRSGVDVLEDRRARPGGGGAGARYPGARYPGARHLGGRRAGGRRAVIIEPDRREAIARALGLAERGDVVVIAGKGHEQGQELAGGVKVPFDDASVAREQLKAMRA